VRLGTGPELTLPMTIVILLQLMLDTTNDY